MAITLLKFNMNNKQFLLNAIHHKTISHIPTMYRGDPATNQKLLKYFGLKDIKKQWKELIKLIGADNFSGGEVLRTFNLYVPKYEGPDFNTIYDPNHFFIWRIKPVEIKVAGAKEIVFHKNPPLHNMDEADELKSFRFPSPDWFDYKVFKIVSEAIWEDLDDQKEIKADNLSSSEEYFLSLYCINCVFMTSMYIRGFDKMMMDLVSNKRYAEILIGSIGEVILEICKRGLKSIGKVIDLYGIWDDFATQDCLMITADIWRRYYKPWTKKLVDEAKKYELLACFHGGIDGQKLIPLGTPNG